MITLKKYKHSINVALLASIMVFGNSCTKDLLDPTPTTSIIDNEAFATPARILSLVNGMYAGVKHGEFYGGRYLIYNEIRGEEFIVNKPNGVTGLDTWNQNVNSNTNEVVSLWSRSYAAINRVNVFLAGLNANSSKVDAATLNLYTGEAEFLRALSYFALVQTYAKPYTFDNGASLGVPLRLVSETTLTGEGTNDLARSTVAQVYAQIIKDLDDAEAKLPATPVTPVATVGAFRAFKNTAIALKTRVYLAQANYTQVLAESAKIVSATAPYQSPNGVNRLESSIATVFGGSYTGSATASETLLSLPFTTTDAPGTQNQLAFYYNNTPGNLEYYLNTAGILANPALSGATSTDARKGFIGSNATVSYLTKFKTASPFTDYIPVIRYAEVLLNAAEAYARTGDLANATALLYAVRRRSDAAYTFAAGDIGSQASLVNTILTERRIELLGEGFRAPDLKRTLQTLPSKVSPQSGTSPAVAPTAANYIWPISGPELQNNKLIVPNP